MKSLLKIFSLTVLFTACNDEKKTDEPAAGASTEKKETAAISYPYKADYSPDFNIGDPNHTKMVLDLYKLWEDNKVDDMRPLLADSIFIEAYDGMKFNNTLDSLISFLKQFRANYSSIIPVFDTWIPVHHKESNEDYVLVWNRDYSTTNDGKKDSLRVHAYFQIKNNKIRGWSEFQQKLTPPPPPPPAKK